MAARGTSPAWAQQVGGADHEVVVVEENRSLEPQWNRSRFHDRYILLKKLGAGACATIYTAVRVDDSSEEEVAVKVTDLRQDRSTGNFDVEVDRKRCKECACEAAVLQKLQSRNFVLQGLDAFAGGGLSYIIMEKCEMTLWRLLERMPMLTESTVKRVFREMLAGLSTVHAMGIVHRDVKPDNFLVGVDGQVKLCDFGFARQLTSAASNAVGLKGVYGTAPFMAPEVLSKELYGAKIDVWSVGVIVYILMFGDFPYMPAKLTSATMKAAIAEGTPAPSFQPKRGLQVTKGRSGAVSTVGRTFCQRLLQRGALDRPTSAEALQDPFFHESNNSDPGSEVSLRPMLFSARNNGAFDLRGAAGAKTEVDRRLAVLQEKWHGGMGDVVKTSKTSKMSPLNTEECSTRAGSEASGSPAINANGLAYLPPSPYSPQTSQASHPRTPNSDSQLPSLLPGTSGGLSGSFGETGRRSPNQSVHLPATTRKATGTSTIASNGSRRSSDRSELEPLEMRQGSPTGVADRRGHGEVLRPSALGVRGKEVLEGFSPNKAKGHHLMGKTR